MHKHSIRIKNQQSGLVSLLVAMILMIVLSLMVLGFAQNTRREQRQSLDRQLYSQANYAAETGINDVSAYIKARQAAGLPLNEFDNCGTTGPPASNFIASSPPGRNIVDGNASYSCVLIDPSPPELIWQRINIDSSVAFPFNPAGPGPPNSEVTISWQDADSVATTYAGCAPGVPISDSFKSQTSWGCQAGALRIDLTPLGGGLTRTGLIDSTQNFVLYPVTGGAPSSVAYGGLGHGSIIPVQCSTSGTPRHCKITISGAGASSYAIRIRPTYRAANIHVTGSSGRSLSDAQAIIDVTGKAEDILRRLQVRLPINALESDINSTFDYALQSIDTTCKLAAIIPGGSPSLINRDISGDPSCP